MSESSFPPPGGAFDAAYFARFYGTPSTRVAEPADSARIARFLAASAALLELPVHRILDVGAGTGRFRRPLLRAFPGARYEGTDVSPYACARYGWRCCSITDLARGSFDLVICHDVLQYLERREAARALERLAERCRGLLYFTALTREDWAQNCDQSRTDRNVHLRGTRWYRRALAGAFRNLGHGVFLRRTAPAVVYSLHALD
jgi:SAM-dependent methyltransferase